MKIEIICVCESLNFLSDGRPYALGIYTGTIPWVSPQHQYDIAALLRIHWQPDDLKPRTLTARLVNPDGIVDVKAQSPMMGNPVPGSVIEMFSSFGGPTLIPKAGNYELQLMLDGSHIEDVAGWPLRFVDMTASFKSGPDSGSTGEPEEPPSEPSGPAGPPETKE